MNRPRAPIGNRQPETYVLRVHRSRRGLRGQIVAVGSGATRLFKSLREALAILKAGLAESTPPATRPSRRPRQEAEPDNGHN